MADTVDIAIDITHIVAAVIAQPYMLQEGGGLVAGIVAPLVMYSTVLMAAASLAMLCIGLVAWVYLRRWWPEIGRSVAHATH